MKPYNTADNWQAIAQPLYDSATYPKEGINELVFFKAKPRPLAKRLGFTFSDHRISPFHKMSDDPRP